MSSCFVVVAFPNFLEVRFSVSGCGPGHTALSVHAGAGIGQMDPEVPPISAILWCCEYAVWEFVPWVCIYLRWILFIHVYPCFATQRTENWLWQPGSSIWSGLIRKTGKRAFLHLWRLLARSKKYLWSFIWWYFLKYFFNVESVICLYIEVIILGQDNFFEW